MNEQELVKELIRQWRINHDDHCRPEWPHEGDCYWPVPPVLAHMSADEILLTQKQS